MILLFFLLVARSAHPGYVDRKACALSATSAEANAEKLLCHEKIAAPDIPWDVLLGLERKLSEDEESPEEKEIAAAAGAEVYEIPAVLIERLGVEVCRFTDTELRAFAAYAMYGPEFNRYIRGEKNELHWEGRFPALIKALDRFLSKMPLSKEEYLVRGTMLPPGVLATFKPGEEITLPGYTSTSIDARIMANFAKGGECWLIRHRSGRMVSHLSSLYSEREVILKRNSRFVVKANRSFDAEARASFQKKKCENFADKWDGAILSSYCKGIAGSCSTYLELEELP